MPKPIATADGGVSDNSEWERGENLLYKQEFLLWGAYQKIFFCKSVYLFGNLLWLGAYVTGQNLIL